MLGDADIFFDQDLEIRRISYLPVQVSARTRWAFIELETSDGFRGIGEATCFQGNHDFAAVTADIENRLRGKQTTAALASTLRPPAKEKTRWAVLSAVEQAIWDIRGKRAAKPVHALLGASLRERVPLYANVNRRSIDRSPTGTARWEMCLSP